MPSLHIQDYFDGIKKSNNEKILQILGFFTVVVKVTLKKCNSLQTIRKEVINHQREDNPVYVARAIIIAIAYDNPSPYKF